MLTVKSGLGSCTGTLANSVDPAVIRSTESALYRIKRLSRNSVRKARPGIILSNYWAVKQHTSKTVHEDFYIEILILIKQNICLFYYYH